MDTVTPQRPPINVHNVISGRYRRRTVGRAKFPDAGKIKDLIIIKISDFLFCARSGGTLHILQQTGCGEIKKVRVLRSIKCTRLAHENNKLYVDSNGSLLELDFNSESAKQHISDSRLIGIFSNIFTI